MLSATNIFLKLNYFQGDYGRANHYLQIAQDNFVQQWSALDTIMTSQRENTLRVIPRLSDAQDFVDLLEKADDSLNPTCFRNLISGWISRSPHPSFEPITTWSDSVIYRCFDLFPSNNVSDAYFPLMPVETNRELCLWRLSNPLCKHKISVSPKVLEA